MTLFSFYPWMTDVFLNDQEKALAYRGEEFYYPGGLRMKKCVLKTICIAGRFIFHMFPFLKDRKNPWSTFEVRTLLVSSSV